MSAERSRLSGSLDRATNRPSRFSTASFGTAQRRKDRGCCRTLAADHRGPDPAGSHRLRLVHRAFPLEHGSVEPAAQVSRTRIRRLYWHVFDTEVDDRRALPAVPLEIQSRTGRAAGGESEHEPHARRITRRLHGAAGLAVWSVSGLQSRRAAGPPCRGGDVLCRGPFRELLDGLGRRGSARVRPCAVSLRGVTAPHQLPVCLADSALSRRLEMDCE